MSNSNLGSTIKIISGFFFFSINHSSFLGQFKSTEIFQFLMIVFVNAGSRNAKSILKITNSSKSSIKHVINLRVRILFKFLSDGLVCFIYFIGVCVIV